MNLTTSSLLSAALLFSLPATSCAAPIGGEPREEELSLAESLESYWVDADALDSFYDLPDSEVRLARLESFDDEWRARLEAIDYDALSVDEAVDWQLLSTRLTYRAALRERGRTQRVAVADLLGFAPALDRLEEARWHLAPIVPSEAALTIAELADEVAAVKARVRKLDESASGADEAEGDEETPAPIELTPAEALRASRWVRSSARTLETWYEHYAAFEPAFAWWVAEPHARAKKQLDELAKKLREDLAGQRGEDDDPLVGAPIGRDALLEDLAGEFLAYTPEELIEIGEAEFRWCEAQLALAATELGHGDDWRAALEQVKRAWLPPGQQDDLVAAQAREMIAWLDDRQLVTIPQLCRETWRVKMLDKRAQRTLPFAAYGGQKMLVAYPTNDMSHEEKLMSLRGNNQHFTRCVTPHELIPGHHLQGFMSQRYATERRRFRTPFLVEGWALYWEMLEWDEGWARGPEDRIGMLFWRAHRAARILVSLRFHLGEMTPEEMIDFLVERVGHEEENATAEVRRYIGDGYSPLYQCGYMIGGLQLRALAAELIGSGKLTPMQFHDAVLRQNAIPVELIRAALSGEKPARDAGPVWQLSR
jgi:uncharacterized protein (DUF885 family)